MPFTFLKKLRGLTTCCKECNKSRTSGWKKANKDRVREYNKYLESSSELYRLSKKVRSVVGCSFKRACQGKYKKSKRTEEILGCSIPEFIQHLQSLFTEGMSLENYGSCTKGNCHEVWHIDHKTPISEAKTEEDIIKLNHYTNLQPLWALDNLSKGNRLDYE